MVSAQVPGDAGRESSRKSNGQPKAKRAQSMDPSKNPALNPGGQRRQSEAVTKHRNTARGKNSVKEDEFRISTPCTNMLQSL